MMENNISVIIPARNEEKNIKKVIRMLKKDNSGIIDEIIVINNASTDRTREIALNEGITVLDCNSVGKGNAMQVGLQYAKNEIVVFLDADVNNYTNKIVEILVEPIINRDADFVKSMFERTGGRVTELVAKPLLNITFPEIYKFSQPLSGMIAGKKQWFKKIEFEKDYGVDIGILLDMIKLGANIEEVHIGKVNNDSQQLVNLEKMAKEVMIAILKRSNNFVMQKEGTCLNNSYITLLNNDDYLIGVLCLNESLKRVHSKYPLNVVITEEVSQRSRQILDNNNIKTIQIRKIEIPEVIKEKNSQGIFSHWNSTFDKLRIFELVQFDKIVMLDSDMYVRKNIDDLFARENLSAVIDRKEPNVIEECKRLTSGIVVIKPQLGIIRKFLDIMIEIIPRLNSMGDQDVLQQYDENWAEKEELHLDVIYNTFFIYLDYYIRFGNYDLDDIAVIHFIFKQKPWNLKREKIEDYFKFLEDRLEYNYEVTNKDVYRECISAGNENKRQILEEYIELIDEMKNRNNLLDN